jgi:periplasmic protein TonB
LFLRITQAACAGGLFILVAAELRRHASVSNHFHGGEKMFGDTLLESSSVPRKGKRWPMATAFTAEAIAAGLLVVIPLLSTVAMPISGRMSCPYVKPVARVTLERVETVRTEPTSASGRTSSGPRTTVFKFNNHQSTIPDHPWADPISEPADPRLPPGGGSDKKFSDFIADGPANSNVKLDVPKRIKSQFEEGQLLNRVEPVYPRIAAISGIQGQVKLHAIIARDGRIQSLNVISGHPLLAHAALEAVEQWRYRPYVLNGEKVEVETFITINFRKEMH